jgi:hypothetical protein
VAAVIWATKDADDGEMMMMMMMKRCIQLKQRKD